MPSGPEERKRPDLPRMPWENSQWERTIQREMHELTAAAAAASGLAKDMAKVRCGWAG